jgi:hypothetical protein
MRFCRLCGVVAVTGAVLLSGSRGPGAADAAEQAPKTGPDKEAVERTREQVKMLDDLYKTAIVGMTKTYVHQQLDTPAAIVAAEVFDAMKKKGHHAARLVDASGKPKSKTNLPDTDFEKKAVKVIKGGKAYYDEVGEKDGKPVLRAATVVPAVMKTCATCHGVKEGTLLGAVVYELPIK